MKDSPQIKFLNSKVFQKKGERVIFDCIVNANPKAKIYWYKNQTRIYESKKYNFEVIEEINHRLYINTLVDGDFTDYFCTAVNLLGKTTSKIELVELRSSSAVGNSGNSNSQEISSQILLSKSNRLVLSSSTTSSTISTTSSTSTFTTSFTTSTFVDEILIKNADENRKLSSLNSFVLNSKPNASENETEAGKEQFIPSEGIFHYFISSTVFKSKNLTLFLNSKLRNFNHKNFFTNRD